MHQFRFLESRLIQSERATDRELQTTPNFLPRTSDAWQHGDRACRHAAVLTTLQTVIHPNCRGPDCNVLVRKFPDIRCINPRPTGNVLRYILLDFLPQILETNRVTCHVISVVKVFVDDDVHHPESQRNISSWINGQIPIGAARGSRAIGVNHHKLRTVALGFLHKGPKMHIVAVDVCTPGNDVTGMLELFRFSTDLRAEHRFESRVARR